jgi:hypothetical protein
MRIISKQAQEWAGQVRSAGLSDTKKIMKKQIGVERNTSVKPFEKTVRENPYFNC